MHQVILFYIYTTIADPEALAAEQRVLAERLGLKGRLIIAEEGINGTFEGTAENTENYIKSLQAEERFAAIHFKRSVGTGTAFPRLSVKVRAEIVSAHLGPQDLNPRETTGTYLLPEELHDWIKQKKEFYVIDMRNDYEHRVGHFANSILPPLKNFRDLPAVLPQLESLRDKVIVTVCTGGVRCEKASGFLVKNGFSQVYQLYGGIVSYMEKYPNEDFLGVLYVFDGRVTMGFNVDDATHTVVGKCHLCGGLTENYIDCAYLHCQGHRHILCCAACTAAGKGFCSAECQAAAELVVVA